MGNAEYMGTHPIFESDFDCLTALTMSDRVAQVISEYSKPREDFTLDLAIKVSGAMVVGGTIGFATRRFHSMSRTLTLSAGIGIGLAVENYSNQLSAPYIKPAVVEVEPKALLLTHSAMPLGSVWEAVSSLTNPKQEEAKPVEVIEEAAVAPVEAETSQETLVEAIVESVGEAVEKAIDEVEEAVAEVREIVVDVAEEVAEVAAEVVEIAEEVETVANEIEAVVHSDTVEEIKAEAEHVAEVAVEIEHVAEEVVAAVAKEE